jgi:exopolyphosphatase / guanosine-5'-triphosphate,3'-diphosphate pyrophosphatase
MNRAVIDIGTNSIKLLVAELRGGTIHPLLEQSEQTRLGAGFYETHELQPQAISLTAQAVQRFVEAAAQWAPERIRIIATSAVRDAVNQSALIDAVTRAAQLPVEVISGEQEAEWVFAGVRSDPQLRNVPLLILDVGGGSTEFILGENDVPYYRNSFRLGTVRLLEQFPVSDPPTPAEWHACCAWLRDFIRAEIAPPLQPQLQRYPQGRVQLVGTGGTTTILGRIQLQLHSFERELLENALLARPQILEHEQRLWSLALAERRKIIGLPSRRADVILTGTSIFARVMEEFGFETLRVSTRGLRFAALLD